ncbi:MAG: hypothetical protein OdinLCB4_000520 [Candidatus Odinarchaeum yellowstonii]|uniref:Uncharacterized protein n=1 Tax=Odinarchaeota yellowstonii (strain LCB_4) TaxID=1841599 RepID=A0AAF0IBJ3_ODILC|nr:MAG: hypothetical protein OdinLCB4_000520 [Candidatus Odinarchaeum yellowstonii]
MTRKRKSLLKKFLISIAVGFLTLATSLAFTAALNYGLTILTILQWLFISAPGILILIVLS